MNIHRAVVADHHPLCRGGLASLLSDRFEIDELIQASNFQQVLAAIARAPDITLVTVNMNLPSMNGVAGLRKLRALDPSLQLVVVAESRDRDVVFAALCAGVHGYILKATPAEEMARAFESVLSGFLYVPPLVSEKGLKGSAFAVTTPSSNTALTDRQFEVLKLVAAGRSNKEIARALLIAESTVKVHINAAFRVLGVHNRVSAAAALNDRSRNDNLSQLFLESRPGADLLAEPPPPQVTAL